MDYWGGGGGGGGGGGAKSMLVAPLKLLGGGLAPCPPLPMPMALRPCQVYFTYKAPISVRVLPGDNAALVWC